GSRLRLPLCERNARALSRAHRPPRTALARALRRRSAHVTAPWRTAWITGASCGIGQALTIALARRGVKVAASARSEAKLSEIAGQHPGIAPLPVDVTALAAMAEASRSIASTLGPIDLAV